MHYMERHDKCIWLVVSTPLKHINQLGIFLLTTNQALSYCIRLSQTGTLTCATLAVRCKSTHCKALQLHQHELHLCRCIAHALCINVIHMISYILYHITMYSISYHYEFQCNMNKESIDVFSIAFTRTHKHSQCHAGATQISQGGNHATGWLHNKKTRCYCAVVISIKDWCVNKLPGDFKGKSFQVLFCIGCLRSWNHAIFFPVERHIKDAQTVNILMDIAEHDYGITKQHLSACLTMHQHS